MASLSMKADSVRSKDFFANRCTFIELGLNRFKRTNIWAQLLTSLVFLPQAQKISPKRVKVPSKHIKSAKK